MLINVKKLNFSTVLQYWNWFYVTGFLFIFIYSQEYISQDTVRIILNKLEKRGYKLKAMTGLGQTCIWTLHKELDDEWKNVIL